MGDEESSSRVKEEAPVKTSSTVKPSLSFSIARLINKVPDAPSAPHRSPGPAGPSGSSSFNPVYPIPMWPSSRLASSDSLNLIRAGVLPSSEMVATLMRHYQQLYGQHLLHQPMMAGIAGLHQPGSNLHKVEILRSAAAAASLHHRTPLSAAAAPHHSKD